jgi:hypothetical protein
MRRRAWFAVLACLAPAARLLLCPAPAAAEVASLGMAGAYSLQARGAEAPSWNPATLAWSRGLSLRFFSVEGSLRNNSFTLADYNRWNGAVWNETDKARILGRIPGSSLEGRFDLSADGPGAAWDGWALTTENHLTGALALPRDVLRLALYGNDPSTDFRLGGTAGDAIGWTELRLSHGREIARARVRLLGSEPIPVAVGVSVKYVRGWGCGEIRYAGGSLQTGMQAVRAEFDLTGRTAQGGSGLALDLGSTAHLPAGWDVGLSLRNPISWIRWSRYPEARREHAVADSINLSNADQGDELFQRESTRTDVPAFNTTLPASAGLAAAGRWKHLQFEADLRQAFSNRWGDSTTPRLALGTCYTPWPWFRGEVGIAVGGPERAMISGGLGFSVAGFYLDLAAATMGTLNPFSPKGVGGGFAIGLR